MDDPEVLRRWASEPLDEHISYTNDEKELSAMFDKIASRVVNAAAQNVVLKETVTPDFRIVAVNAPTLGTATIVGERTIIWTMDYVGVSLSLELISLTFEIMHVGTTGGVKEFNQSVVYQDQARTELNFPAPTIEVICNEGSIYPEPCPVPTVFTVDGCKDAVHVQLQDAVLVSLGRIVQVDVVLKAIFPGKRVAVSVILNEVGPHGELLPRGIKHVLVPAQTGTGCRDLTIRCIQFSLPEALDATGNTDSICNARTFQTQVIANYVDTDYVCCGGQETVIVGQPGVPDLEKA